MQASIRVLQLCAEKLKVQNTSNFFVLSAENTRMKRCILKALLFGEGIVNKNTKYKVRTLCICVLEKVDPGVKRGIRLLHSARTNSDSTLLLHTLLEILLKYKKYKYVP